MNDLCVRDVHGRRTGWPVVKDVATRVYKQGPLLLFVLAVIGVSQSQTFTVLHTFTGIKDGGVPNGDLLLDAAGNLYGTTQHGGRDCDCGTVFKLKRDGSIDAFSFDGTHGKTPEAGLISDGSGNLYGTTSDAKYGPGVVFKLDGSGYEDVLHAFTGGSDGANPVSSLVLYSGNYLYGTTEDGGTYGFGTVFMVDLKGNETVLYSFRGGSDGQFPFAGLAIDPEGHLYGTTYGGGAYGDGTIFEVNGFTETVLHSFDGLDGDRPAGALTYVRGSLYGTAEGGVSGGGVVFRLGKYAKLTVLYNFIGPPNDGGSPSGRLITDPEGNLYGTTAGGGTFDMGTVFKLDSNGTETVLYSFTGGVDGAIPIGGLVRDLQGNLYGTAGKGGQSCGHSDTCGTLFMLTQ